MVLALRAFAAEHGVAIVLVHHLRKQDFGRCLRHRQRHAWPDPAVDRVLTIKRDARGDFILHGRGRDLPEIEKAMIFNTNTCTWAITGEAAAVRISTERRRIIQAMKDIGAPAGPKDIAAIAELKTENVNKVLGRMAAEKIVIRNSHGKYGLPPNPSASKPHEPPWTVEEPIRWGKPVNFREIPGCAGSRSMIRMIAGVELTL